MNTNNRAALLDRDNQVIGEVLDAPSSSRIEVAGCFTINGDAVNVRTYRISRSKRNLQKAQFEQRVTKIKNVYTFHCVEDDEIVY